MNKLAKLPLTLEQRTEVVQAPKFRTLLQLICKPGLLALLK
jgi:hypothetical protein